MAKSYNVAVVGATGIVGEEFLKILAKRLRFHEESRCRVDQERVIDGFIPRSTAVLEMHLSEVFDFPAKCAKQRQDQADLGVLLTDRTAGVGGESATDNVQSLCQR